MTWPLLFSLTSCHTPLHLTHSVLATLNLLFLDYIELIFARGLCISSSWNVLLPDFGMALSVPSLSPDLCSDITAIDRPSCLPYLYSMYLSLPSFESFVGLLIRVCVCMCSHF